MYQKAIALAPDNYLGYRNLGGVYLYQNRYDESIANLNRSIDLRPTYEAYVNLAAAYFLLHQFQASVAASQRALQLDEHGYITWGNLADALYWIPSQRQTSFEAYRRAISLGRRQLEVNARDATTLGYVAEYSAMLGDKETALSDIQRASQEAPHDPQVLFQAAQVYNRFGDVDQSLSWLKKAIDAGYPRQIVGRMPDFDPLKTNSRFRMLVGIKPN